MERKRLVRSENNRLIAGVCGGLAEYFDTDPNLVRLICIVLILIQPVMAIIYLLMAVLLPRGDAMDNPIEIRLEEGLRELGESIQHLVGEVVPAGSRFYVGVVFTIVGLLMLLRNLGFWWIGSRVTGALLLIALGAYLLLPRGDRA